MLDERKLSILYAIINSYITHAEPVGSRTISKCYDLGVSSATIRNEMSDLEGLGYLNKAHTSSGRIPSDKAYRLYVDYLLGAQYSDLTAFYKSVGQLLVANSSQIESLVSGSARLLSELTKYTSLSMITNYGKLTLRKLQLIRLDGQNLILVMIYDKEIVRHTAIWLDEPIDSDTVNFLNSYLDKYIVGKNLKEIPSLLEEALRSELSKYDSFLGKMGSILGRDAEELEETYLIYDGISNIFNYPEYKNIDRAKAFVDFLEDRDALISALLNDRQPLLNISIGEENKEESLSDMAIITASYNIGEDLKGKIGIIGPKRMDYEKVIAVIVSLANELERIVG